MFCRYSSAGHDWRRPRPAALGPSRLLAIAPRQPTTPLQQQHGLQPLNGSPVPQRQQFAARVARTGRPANFKHVHEHRPQSHKQFQLPFVNGITEHFVRQQ